MYLPLPNSLWRRPGPSEELLRKEEGILPSPLWGSPGPGSRQGSAPGRRAPARGVDVKPPPGRDFGGPKKPLFGVWAPFYPQNQVPRGPPPRTKLEKGPKMAIIPHFGVFLGILGPRSPFRAPRGGCFYINPSRRGPVAHFSRILAGDPCRGVFRDPRDGEGFRSPRGLSGIQVPGPGDRSRGGAPSPGPRAHPAPGGALGA